MVGTGIGARRGILIRDIDALQHAEKIQTVVLDKTGTLTVGKMGVSSIISSNGLTETDILKLAATAEQYSEHPIGRAIVAEALRTGVHWDELEEFENHPGFGVIAEIDGRRILVGNEALLARNGITSAKGLSTNGTTVFVGEAGKSSPVELGRVILSDSLKPDSQQAISALHNMRLKTVLLTGDNESAARQIAAQANIDCLRFNIRPGQKAEIIREFQLNGDRVAMVGDGINDAPALAQADLGLAMGTGSDIAKETGGIVLVRGSVADVAVAIKLSRLTMKTIRQNLFFAFAYNILAIPLAALGLLSPLIAAGAMALSDVTVIGNALRLKWRNLDT